MAAKGESNIYNPNHCDAASLCGVICILIGILKHYYKWDDEDRRSSMCISGIVKIISSKMVKYTPDAFFQKFFSALCVIGLASSIAGAILDLLLQMFGGSKRHEVGEIVMLLGWAISSASSINLEY